MADILALVPPSKLIPGRIDLPSKIPGTGLPIIGAPLLVLIALATGAQIGLTPPPRPRKQREKDEAEEKKKVLKWRDAVKSLDVITIKDVLQIAVVLLPLINEARTAWTSIVDLEHAAKYESLFDPLKAKLRNEMKKYLLSQDNPRHRRKATTYSREESSW